MNQQRVFMWVFLAVGLLVLGGCGGSAPPPVVDPVVDPVAAWPAWYSDVPQDDTAHLAAATSTSSDPQFAVDEAEISAQARLATQMSVELEGLMTRFQEEVGSGEDAQMLDKTTRAIKRTMDQVLKGSRIRKQKTLREGKIWRAFVLAELPVKEVQKALLGEITKDEEMYIRFRESQAFQALEKDLK